jgi:hypothetical protein
MIKLSAISPRTNSFYDVQSGESSPENSHFEMLFSEMAHATLGARSPQLAESIVHFKVISTEMEKNAGVGVFICEVGQNRIHIPVILAAGKVKPPDTFYLPEKDRYLPLTSKWLDEVSNTEIESLGSPFDTNKMNFSDSSLGQVSSPPTARNKFSSYDLPVAMSRVPNRVKTAMANYFKSNTDVMRKAVKYHGSDIIKSMSKTANYLKPVRRSWVILDSNASADTFKTHFGKTAAVAFQQSQRFGYAYADFRKNAGLLVKESAELPSSLSEPGDSGIYKIMKSDGSHVRCLIISNPVPVNTADRMSDYKYLVILENGDYLETDNIVAIPTAESLDSDSMIYKRLENLTVKSGLQTLIRYSDGVMYNASCPVELSGVTTRKDGVVVAQAGSKKAIFDSPSSVTSIHAPSGESVVFVPKSYKSLPLRNRLEAKEYVLDASHATSIVNGGTSKEASRLVVLRRNSLGDLVVNGQSCSSTKEAMFKMASMGCSIESAASVLPTICGTTERFYVVPRSSITKLASIFGPSAPQGQAAQAPLPPDMSQQQQQQQPMMDPQTGEPVDPTTGLPIDPQSGMPYNPETGALVDPQTGQELDPETGEPLPSPEEQSLMDSAAKANDQMVLDSAMVATLINEANMPELTSEYMPRIESGLDAICRILLTLQLKFDILSEKLGLEELSKLENNVRKVSMSLGDIILRLKNASSLMAGDNGEFQQ